MILPPGELSSHSGVGGSSKGNKKKKNKTAAAAATNCNSSSAAVNNHPQGEQQQHQYEAAPTDPAKKLRNLRKKLRDIENLEKKLESGEIANPEPEQLEKVGRKDLVEEEIASLEKQLS